MGHRDLFFRLGVGKLFAISSEDSFSIDSLNDINRVLVCRTVSSLGNMLGLTPLISELAERIPGVKIDIIVGSDVAPDLYRGLPNVDQIYCLPRYALKHPLRLFKEILAVRKNNYDLVINPVSSRSGRLLVSLVHAKMAICAGDSDEAWSRNGDGKHFAKYPVLLFRSKLASAQYNFSRPTPILNLALSSGDLSQGKASLNEITQAGENKAKTILIFTNATGDKCYDREWWESFYFALAEKTLDANFVEVLPAHGESRLSFKIPAFNSRNLRELASFIAAADLFVGADSGVMHLASAAKTPTVGLFCVTPINVWKPYGNDDEVIDTNDCSAREIAGKVGFIYSKLSSA